MPLTIGRGGRRDLATALLASAILTSTSLAATGQTPPAAEASTRSFDVAPQPLTSALAAFSDATGIQFFFDAALARDVTSPGVVGTMAAKDALRHLLSGTGMSYRFTNPSTVTLEKVAVQGAMTLDPITVESSASGPATRTEGSESYIAEAVTVGSKLPVSVREIPQSVSVVTRDRIEDENLSTVQDALEETTGVRVQRWDGTRATFTARGHAASVLRDGISLPHSTQISAAPDLAVYDHLEVLRGPAGLFHGAGEAGGSLNLVRKRALADPQIRGMAQVGSWNHHRVEGDVTGPFDAEGKIRGRLVAAYTEEDSFIDGLETEQPLVYGTVEVDPTPDTTLAFGVIHQEVDRTPFQGLPIAYTTGDPITLPRHTNPGAQWASDENMETDVFADLTHQFANGIDVNLGGRVVLRERDVLLPQVVSLVTPGTGDVSVQAYDGDSDHRDIALDANLGLPWRMFGQDQKATVGVDASWSREENWWSGSATYTTSIFTPDHHVADPGNYTPSSHWDLRTQQTGLYGQAFIKPGIDWLTLVGGGRLSWWSADRKDKLANTVSYDTSENGRVTPMLGAVADLTEALSVYGSYATIFEPQTQQDPSGGLISPREGEQYEVGLKGDFLDGALIGHLAAYQIDDTNRATMIDDCVGSLCYEAAGEVRSQGVEAEISGQPAPGWQVLAGYAYTYTTYRDDPANEGNVYAPYIPKHMVNLSANYTLQEGGLAGLTIGGGARLASAQFYQYQQQRYTQSAYAVFDARIGYDWDGISAQLNVNNLFDAEYYERLAGMTRNNFWGTPRSAMLTVRADF